MSWFSERRDKFGTEPGELSPKDTIIQEISAIESAFRYMDETLTQKEKDTLHATLKQHQNALEHMAGVSLNRYAHQVRVHQLKHSKDQLARLSFVESTPGTEGQEAERPSLFQIMAARGRESQGVE